MVQVGVRELKNRLSEYLLRVKAGERIIITEYKKPVAQIVALEVNIPEKMAELIREGSANWNGNKPGSVEPVEPTSKSVHTIGEIVTEDRR